jgi:MinD superfamily P-loop ATPase
VIIAIASGKGGTGKTTIAVNLALSLENVQLIDCDVEEPNAHLFLNPEITAKEEACIPVPRVDMNLCNFCGKCREVCAYGAIAVLPPSGNTGKGQVLVFDHLCHGCGACAMLCPQKAIHEENRVIGVIEKGRAGSIDFVYGRLNIGEAMSPPLIRQVKKFIDRSKTVIIDAPPGTSCPVIAAVKGSDYVLLVTEPTPFGFNDLKLAVETARVTGLPFGVIINRSDDNDGIIEGYCKKENIDVLMKIPFMRQIAEIYSRGGMLVAEMPEYRKKFLELMKKIPQNTAD